MAISLERLSILQNVVVRRLQHTFQAFLHRLGCQFPASSRQQSQQYRSVTQAWRNAQRRLLRSKSSSSHSVFTEGLKAEFLSCREWPVWGALHAQTAAAGYLLAGLVACCTCWSWRCSFSEVRTHSKRFKMSGCMQRFCVSIQLAQQCLWCTAEQSICVTIGAASICSG